MRRPEQVIELWIPNEPRPKGRPRAWGTPGGKPRIYTPESTQAYERLVRSTAIIEMQRRGWDTFKACTPLKVRLDFFLTVPMSKPYKWREKALTGEHRPTKRPDLDNLEKSILDGLNGTAWSDDCQIVEIISAKWWAMEPGCMVTIKAVEVSEDGSDDQQE